MKRCIPEVLSYAHTNFKNDEKLNEIVKISEQPTKGLTQILHTMIKYISIPFLFH